MIVRFEYKRPSRSFGTFEKDVTRAIENLNGFSMMIELGNPRGTVTSESNTEKIMLKNCNVSRSEINMNGGPGGTNLSSQFIEIEGIKYKHTWGNLD